MTDTYCSPDLEYLAVGCCPLYLPWEFTVVTITAVYVPTDAYTTTASGYLLTIISKQQLDHPDRVFVIAGDFDKANLKTVLPKFHQHVHCPTRGSGGLRTTLATQTPAGHGDDDMICHITRQSNTSSSAVEAEQLNLFFGHFTVIRTRTNVDPAPVINNQASSPNWQMWPRHSVISTHGKQRAQIASWAGPQRLCCRIRWGIFKWLQPFSVTVQSPHLPEDIHNSASSKAGCCNIPQRYRSVALTPVIVKCLESLVLRHIKAALPPTLDPHQYRANRSMDNSTSTVLHTVLHHLEQHGHMHCCCSWTTAPRSTPSYPADCFPRCPTWVYHTTSAFGLFDRSTTVSQDGPASLLYSDTQHRGQAGLCAEPVPLLFLYTWLHSHHTSPTPSSNL